VHISRLTLSLGRPTRSPCGSPELRREARTAIESADRAYVSSATIWEMAVKVARGRLEAPPDFPDRLLDLGILQLALEWEHARVAGGLPRHHRDPFDRMLVAQAIVERLTIVTRDDDIARYPVPVIVA
jgi:PIN domain nuclease of toxin-antitoxin system